MVGSAVNVIGHDDFRQHLTFMSGGEKDARARVLMGRYRRVIPTELPAKAPRTRRRARHGPSVGAQLPPRCSITPYFAVTKPDGSFSIGNVPPGTYTLRAWHREQVLSEQKVTVSAGAVGKVDIALKTN